MTLMRWTPHTELWDPFHNLADIREEMNRLLDRKSTRLNSSHSQQSRMPSSA